MPTYRVILIAIMVILLSSPAIILGNVTVDPSGFAVYAEPDNEIVTELTLSNNGEQDVSYRARYMKVDRGEEEGQRLGGPRRDDPGDEIFSFESDDPGALGIGRDFETDDMWVCHTYLNDAGVPIGGVYKSYRMDGEEYEVVAEVDPGMAPLGGTYFNGVLYATVWQNQFVIRHDLDGENLGNLDTPGFVMACAVDPERGLLFVIIYQTVMIVVYDIENDFEEVGRIENVLERENDADFRGRIYWAPEHDDGNLWLSYEWSAYQLSIDEDWGWEEVQSFDVDTDVRSFGIAHDGRDLWIGNMYENTITVTDDGINEPNWFNLVPETGVITAGEDINVDAVIIPGELEPGVYEMMLTLSLSDPDQPKLEMAVIMSLESEVTSITGVVSDERSGAVIENATIEMDYFEIKRFSDNEGNFSIADLPPGDYELLFTAEDYLPLIEAVSIAEGDDDIELNIEMLQAVFGINVDDLAREVAPDEQIEIGFTVSNSGNGTLEFSTVRSLAGGADADPWTLRQSINVGEILDDTRINGVLYIDELYYIAGGHNREPVIYIMNTDGQEEGVIELDTEDNTGMRDLAFDGELIWGAIGNLVIGMTLEGEVIHSWESPYNPTNNITWDTDRNVLWLCSTTSDPIAFDREGNQIEDLVVDHLDYRIYGLSYWEDEPEGYPLILFCKDRETDMQLIVKCDPEGGGDGDGDLQNVTFLEPEAGGTPAGSYITNTFDIYSWVLICNSNNAPNAGGDRIDIWQLDTRMSWFMLDQEEGSIDPGDELNLTLTLDATEIPPAQFEGLITFIHNGVGDDVEIPVFMNVILGPVHSSRTLELNFGWNMVSTNLQPDEDGIVELTRNLVEDDLLILIKDGIGRFYNPEYGYNNIPGWEVANGYLVKMADAGSLELEGTTVLFNDPIDLTEGWQMISYFPRDPVNAITALSGLEDNLVMAKDGQGRFYNREYGYSNMVDMCEGSGYLVKVNENAELVYRLRIPDEDENVGPMEKNAVKPTASQNFPAPTPTASNMSILVLNPDGIDAEIGVFAGDILVGSGIIRDDLVGISVWGDDPTTEALDGALQNQNLEIQLFQETSEFSFQMDWVEGEAKYSINEFAVLSITTDQQAPVEFGLLAPHPNPFNSRIKLSYSLTRSGEVNLSIFDLSGREIDNIVTGNQTAGHYSINWEAASQASGVYLVRFEAESRTQSRKIVLVK